MTKMAIIGAGGHARSLINILEHYSFNIVGLYDDAYQLDSLEEIRGYNLMGKIIDIPEDVNIVIALGNNQKREVLFNVYLPFVFKDNLFHPKAFSEKQVAWGNSNQIFANAYINSDSKIGNNNIINSGAIIEHEVVIGNHNHIAIHATLCGRSVIGNNCFVGSGAIVIEKITIADNITIGANSVVTKNLIEPGVYVGSPVRRVK